MIDPWFAMFVGVFVVAFVLAAIAFVMGMKIENDRQD